MTSSDEKIKWQYWIVPLVIIMIVGFAVRVKFCAGLIPTDDAEYAKIAYQISRGEFDQFSYNGPAVCPVRTGIVLPIALIFKMFGPSEWSLMLYPLILSSLIMLIVFLLTSKLYDYKAGLIAIAIWVMLPIEIEIATRPWPDLPSTFYAILGVYIVVCIRQNTRVSPYWKMGSGVLAGIAFGLSWLCKASVVYFIPFCLVLLLYDCVRDWKNNYLIWAGVGIGSIAVFGAENLIYFIQTDQWLYRLKEIERNYAELPEWFFGEGKRFGYPEGTPFIVAVLKRVIKDGPTFILLNGKFLYLPIFGLIACAYGLYWRDRRSYSMILLFASLFLMYNFFSSSFSAYMPLPLFNRYFYPICIPSIILISGLMARSFFSIKNESDSQYRKERTFWWAMVLGMVLMIGMYHTFRTFRDYRQTWSYAEKQIATIISPNDIVYTNRLGQNALEFFWKYPEDMNVVNYAELPNHSELKPGSYVLKNREYGEWLTINYGTWMNRHGYREPDNIRNPSDSWETVWQNNQAVLYRLPEAAKESSGS